MAGEISGRRAAEGVRSSDGGGRVGGRVPGEIARGRNKNETRAESLIRMGQNRIG